MAAELAVRNAENLEIKREHAAAVAQNIVITDTNTALVVEIAALKEKNAALEVMLGPPKTMNQSMFASVYDTSLSFCLFSHIFISSTLPLQRTMIIFAHALALHTYTCTIVYSHVSIQIPDDPGDRRLRKGMCVTPSHSVR